MFCKDVSSLEGSILLDQISIHIGQWSQWAAIHLSQVSFPVIQGLRVHRYLSSELQRSTRGPRPRQVQTNMPAVDELIVGYTFRVFES